MLEKYTKMFSNLRTDKGRNRYPAITRYRAPHKPFLPLSVMDLIAQGQITANFIAPTFDLLDTFNSNWSAVMPDGKADNTASPSLSRVRGRQDYSFTLSALDLPPRQRALLVRPAQSRRPPAASLQELRLR